MLIRVWFCIATLPLAIVACKSGQDTSSAKSQTPVQAASRDAEEGADSARRKASFADPDLDAVAGDPKAPENVVRAWVAAFNSGDIEGIKRVTAEDMLTYGIAQCKGTPCTTQKQHLDLFVIGSVKAGFQVDRLRVRPGPRGTWLALLESHLPNDDWGSQTVRAYWDLTIKDGRITRLANHYDLLDPGTVLLRKGIDDFAFALHNPDPLDPPRVRGMVTWVGPPADKTSAVTLYSYDPSLDQTHLAASLHKGSCRNLGPVVHPLSDLFAGRSDTLVKLDFVVLLSGEYMVAVWSPDKELLACGGVPRVKIRSDWEQ